MKNRSRYVTWEKVENAVTSSQEKRCQTIQHAVVAGVAAKVS